MRVFGEFGEDGRFAVRSVGSQGSHQLAATARANALAVLADGDGVDVNDPVSTILLSVV